MCGRRVISGFRCVDGPAGGFVLTGVAVLALRTGAVTILRKFPVAPIRVAIVSEQREFKFREIEAKCSSFSCSNYR